MRRYLAGQLRHAVLDFLSQALKRGSEIYAALYEVNDEELIQAIEAFGPAGHVLLGNGSAMLDGLADRLAKARLEVKTRELSKAGRSSPSVHNKFVVEVQPHAGPTRVLTGSTNWTVSGLSTQLNNTLLIEGQKIAERFRKQWDLFGCAEFGEARRSCSASPRCFHRALPTTIPPGQEKSLPGACSSPLDYRLSSIRRSSWPTRFLTNVP